MSASGRTAPTPQSQIQSNVRLDINGLDDRTRTTKGMRHSHIHHIFTHSSDDDNHAVANESLWALKDEEGLDAAQWPLVWSSFNNFPIPKSAISSVGDPSAISSLSKDDQEKALREIYKYLLKHVRFIGFNQTDMNFTRRIGMYDKPANGTAIHHGIVQTVNTSSREIRAGNYVRIRPPGRPIENGLHEWEHEKSINTKTNGMLGTKSLGILEAVDPDDVETIKQDVRDYLGLAETVDPTLNQILEVREHLPPVIGVANTTAVSGGEFVELRVFFKAR